MAFFLGNRKLDKIYPEYGFFWILLWKNYKPFGIWPMRHEGKVTGLAAYGNPKNALNLCKKMM